MSLGAVCASPAFSPDKFSTRVLESERLGAKTPPLAPRTQQVPASLWEEEEEGGGGGRWEEEESVLLFPSALLSALFTIWPLGRRL